MNLLGRLFVKMRLILQRSMVRDTGILTVSQYVGAGFGFLTNVFACRLLGPSDYGIACLIMAYPLLLWSFVNVKSVSVTTRYISGFRATGQNEEIKSICKLGFGIDLFVSLIAFILVSVTSLWATQHILSISQNAWIMIAYAASLPLLSLAGTSWAILTSLGRFRWLAVSQILDKAITFFIVSGLLLSGLGVWGMVIGIATGQAIFGLLMMGIATYILYRDGVGLWWRGSIKNMIPLRQELCAFFGWNYILTTLSGLIAQGPLILLGHLRGPVEAGFYRLAMSLTTAGSYLTNSLGWITYPVLSARWVTGERENLKGLLKRWTFRALPVGIPLFLIIPLLPIVVPLAFGTAYSAMVPGLYLMVLGTIVSALFFWLVPFYYSTRRIDLWTKGYAFYTALVIGLGWLCIQRWGFLGLAGILALGQIGFTLAMLALIEKVIAEARADESRK